MMRPPKWMSEDEIAWMQSARQSNAVKPPATRVHDALRLWDTLYSFPPTLRELAWAAGVCVTVARRHINALADAGECVGAQGNTRAIALRKPGTRKAVHRG